MSARFPVPAFSVTVHGLPAPQGSKRHVGEGRMVESSAKVRPWRQDVKHAALEVVGDGWTLLDGPLVVSMVFAFGRPKGHYRTGQWSHLVRDSAPARPFGMPDLSKLVRSTEDALTGVVWKDDSRVVEYLRLGKWFAGARPDVPQAPGCTVHVWPLAAVYCPHGWRIADGCGRCSFDRVLTKPKPGRGVLHPHYCLSCSDGEVKGSGCLNCRQTGFDQTPWPDCRECAS